METKRKKLFRSSDESIQSIIKVVTPSPLTSSRSSDRSSSLLVDIDDLISEASTRPIGRHEEETSGEEAKDEEFLEAFDSPQSPREESLVKKKSQECLTDSAGGSVESSASSLKRRLRNLPTPSEAIKLADRVAALDRRIRWEKVVYLHLQEQADRIEEKDEPEVGSLTGNSSGTSTKNLFHDDPKTVGDPRARRRAKMCSSAPETIRLNEEPFERSPPSEVMTTLNSSLVKKFEDRRPPKYLEPMHVPVKEILRCNAPALCISDKRIAELLRRGSVSAREEYIKKSAMPATKLAGTKRPTGMIIKNLSSGSEEDCANHWLIRGGFSVPKFKTEASISDSSNFRFDGSAQRDESSIPKDSKDDRQMVDVDREESESLDHRRSSTISIAAQKPAHNGKTRAGEDKELLDHLPSAEGGGRLAKTSLQSSMDRLKSVLRDFESNSQDSPKFNVPKLEIHSREYSHSVSLSSREGPARRSLDMNALIRALSDVSIQQRETVDRRVERGLCESVVSTAPMSSPYTSKADGSRQSMSSVENAESQEQKTDRSKTRQRSRGSLVRDKKIERADGSSNGRSRIPISAGEANDGVSKCRKEPRKIAQGRIVVAETRVPALERNSKRFDTSSSPTKRSPKYQSSRPPRIPSPEPRKSRKPKPVTDDSSMREKSSGLAKNGFPSFETLAKNLVKHDRNKKLTNGPAAVSSEPGTSRNDRRVLRDRLSSRVTSGASDILPRVLGHDPGSTDDKFKYLQRGSKLPYSRSSAGSSSSEQEGSEFELKIMRPSATGFQSADLMKTEAKFKIHEDTDEASSPRNELAFPIEKNERRTASPSPRRSQPTESGNSFRADSSGELNRAMSCCSEYGIEVAKNAIPDGRSYLVSPANASMKRTSSSSELTGSSKISSNRSLTGSGSSASTRCRYDDNTRLVSKNLAAGTLEDIEGEVGRKFEVEVERNFEGEVGRKFEGEGIFATTSVVKRLSYSESRAPHSEESNSGEEQSPLQAKRSPEYQPEISSPDEEFIEDTVVNTSRTNLAGAGMSDRNLRRFGKALDRAKTGSDSKEQSPFRAKRSPEYQPEVSSPDEEFIEDVAATSSRTNLAGMSDGNLRRFGKALDRAKTGSKISSSLSKLPRSPEELNLVARKSQDRFPFTISENTSANSSSKLRVKNAIQGATSGCAMIDPPETAYKLRAHPSLLRLAGAGYEATAAEIIDSASRHPAIMVGHGNFVKKFVRKFSKRSRPRKRRNESRCETTQVLYENKECRVGSAEESSGSNAVEKPGRAFDRDGLWVEGLWDKNRSCGELPGTKEQDIIDRYTIFLAKRDQHRNQFGESAFPPETPINFAEIDDDRDIDPGCFCAKFCNFFIGGNIHYRKRSTLFLRARSSRLRRRF